MLDSRQLHGLGLPGVTITAAIDGEGNLLPVVDEFPKLLAAAREKSFPRTHAVVVAWDQPLETKGLAADPQNPSILRDPRAEFRIVRARNLGDAVSTLRLLHDTCWRGIDCSLPLADPHFVGRERLFAAVRDFVGHHDSGHLILVGGMGKGKTTFLSELVRREEARGQYPVFHIIDHHPSATGKLSQIAACLYDRLRLSVIDDSPDGFADLAHAYTLFAESRKKANPQQRGRFNLGEKLVLALCKEARLTSTRGTVQFSRKGRRNSASRTPCGTEFHATLRMNRSEYREACEYMRALIPPAGVETTFNGALLEHRTPVHAFRAVLPTVTCDENGVMRSTRHEAVVEVHTARGSEVPSIYELGLPVVETGDKWHINVLQKVPLNMDRDNVTPGYLRELRVAVLNEMHPAIQGDDTTADWVREAAADARCSDEATTTLITERFGERRASYDPSDVEAVNRLRSQGYTIVPSGGLSKGEWQNAKRAGALKAAGAIAPTPRVRFAPDGEPLNVVGEEKRSAGMKLVVDYSRTIARELLEADVTVTIANEPGIRHEAWWGDVPPKLTYNVARLGRKWFDEGIREAVDELILHELGHHYEPDHLDAKYHAALCRLGAKMKRLALERPQFFDRFRRDEMHRVEPPPDGRCPRG